MGSVAIPSSGGSGNAFKDWTVTTYNRNGSQEQTFSCEIGDIIVVGLTTSSDVPQSAWYPTIKSGGTLIQNQYYNDGSANRDTGLIGVATSKNVTIRWYQAGSTDSKVKIIHTGALKGSTYTIEKNYATAMSRKTITNLKPGDLIVGNTGYLGTAYNSIGTATKAASLDGSAYVGQPFMTISDSTTLSFYGSGSTSQYTIVAFRQS